MKPTDFEKDLLFKFFDLEQIDSREPIESLDEIDKLDRTIEGSGLIIEFPKHPCLRVGAPGQTYRWGRFGGHINEEIHVGFLFNIEDGYIESVEGYTYGEPWPDKVVCYDFYSHDEN